MCKVVTTIVARTGLDWLQLPRLTRNSFAPFCWTGWDWILYCTVAQELLTALEPQCIKKPLKCSLFGQALISCDCTDACTNPAPSLPRLPELLSHCSTPSEYVCSLCWASKGLPHLPQHPYAPYMGLPFFPHCRPMCLQFQRQLTLPGLLLLKDVTWLFMVVSLSNGNFKPNCRS